MNLPGHWITWYSTNMLELCSGTQDPWKLFGFSGSCSKEALGRPEAAPSLELVTPGPSCVFPQRRGVSGSPGWLAGWAVFPASCEHWALLTLILLGGSSLSPTHRSLLTCMCCSGLSQILKSDPLLVSTTSLCSSLLPGTLSCKSWWR